MKITILTLFPQMFKGFVEESIIKRAIEKEVVEVKVVDIRDYSLNKHRHVDDTPCGGGAGMVLQVDVCHRAIKDNTNLNSHIVMMTPQGIKYDQKVAQRLAKEEDLVLLCGHYEGFDERIRDYVTEEISIGDYVLTGGEIPAMALADSVIRLLDHAIKEESHLDDSFSTGLLEYPQYTRPIEYENKKVPEVLLNGNHKEIKLFRKKEALRRTYLKRPDLLKDYNFSSEDKKLLDEIIKEEK
ncbi:MAG: tRNA (guanosine(37)-N1)-methyltransferase TrmD [Acholeplasmatales bacterium]|nr:tRNA (guanosine(37)-N1)-methyltransferase TrmD [Acholeplasmatales bacterium]